MVSLEVQLKVNETERNQILERIDEGNGKRKISCEGCNQDHRIGDIEAIQTHWYVWPSGCTEGDYWNEGELQFICPETEIINRLLFSTSYDNLGRSIDNPELQFNDMYKRLFKGVEDTYTKETRGEWRNNYYVDSNRKMFGLTDYVPSKFGIRIGEIRLRGDTEFLKVVSRSVKGSESD
ncbi:MAG: hypothetical protein IH845_03705 [Nanoarchaeota archaeon]|nr:hypothetical protein [Nanoarchaeota archaeon]